MNEELHARIARVTRNTISDGLRRSVARSPEKTALVFEERRWSYRALDAAVDRVARRLLDLGLSPGDRVAAFGKNSDAYAILFLACARAGFIHVPVNFALTGEELGYILEQCGARAVFYDPSLAEALASTRDRLSATVFGTIAGPLEGEPESLLDAITSEETVEPVDAEIDDRAVAQILYTSGTTAAPKGAMMTHRALMSHYMSCIPVLDIAGSDPQLAALPLYHSAQMHVFLLPSLLSGVTTFLLQAPVPDRCFPLIEREKIRGFFAPPTVWISMLRHPGFDAHDLASLTKIYYGASIMPVPVLQELRQRLPGAQLYNCYGQSEIGPLATVLGPDEHDARPASAGRPILNVQTRVVDPMTMEDVAPGEQGEIVHRSPQLLVGYWDKPEETEEAFRGGWFHSGDVATRDEEGYLYIVDRIKDVINTGGVVVSSREVEEALFTHPAVSEAAVVGLPDERWIEAITAFVVLKDGRSASSEELTTHTKQHLAPFKVPKRVIFVDDLPRNTAGKLLKRQLRDRYA